MPSPGFALYANLTLGFIRIFLAYWVAAMVRIMLPLEKKQLICAKRPIAAPCCGLRNLQHSSSNVRDKPKLEA